MKISKKWVKIGNHAFSIEDLRGCWVQKNHLIMELDFKQDHVVFHFGKDGQKKCEKAFEQLCEAKDCYIIEADADYNPDLMKTFYGDQFDRQLKSIRMFEADKLKVRYQKKIEKLMEEVEKLKEITRDFKK